MLCKACTQIFEEQVKLKDARYHSTKSELQKACQVGCQLCQILWLFFMKGDHNDLGSQQEYALTYIVLRGKDSTMFGYSTIPDDIYLLIFSLNVEIGGSVDAREGYRMFIVEPFQGQWERTVYNALNLPLRHLSKPEITDNVQDLLRYSGHSTFPSHTGSETCLTLAQDWIARCLRQHARCNKSRQHSESYYPTRLVEIPSSTDGTDLHLCPTYKNAPTGPYMTLSHRWGNASFLQLTLSNLSDLVKGFSIADLPQTFQDAIAVVRRLGCTYIWIDSLCIIQDSKEDWSHEAGLMGKVYANSHCNIAATWNSSSDDGLFTERNVPRVEGIFVSPQWADLKSSTTFRVVDYGLWESLITSAGLNQRAWVVQERLLAPRVLHFGLTQLAWECHEVDACESYPTNLPVAQQNARTMQKGLDPDIDGKELQLRGDSRYSINLRTYHVWQKMVTAYTAGELTVASDKLVAISGLATNMQILLQDIYLGGLWKRTLASDLLWKVNGGKQANGLFSTRAEQYRAPTWSWAALDGQIMPGRPNIDRILVSIEEAVTKPLISEYPLGQLQYGWLRLRGALLQGKVKRPESSASRPEKININFSARDVTTDHWILPDIQDEIFHQSLFCLIVSTRNQYDGTLIQGLALHCVDTVAATFRRVGLFESNHQSGNQDLPVQYSPSTRRVELSKDAKLRTIVLV